MNGPLTSVWHELTAKGIDRELLLARSTLAPASCCLINPDEEKTVEADFAMVHRLPRRLRARGQL